MIADNSGREIVVIHSDICEVRWVAALLKTAFPGTAFRQFTDTTAAMRHISSNLVDIVMAESGLRCTGGGLLVTTIRDVKPNLPVIVMSESGVFAEMDAAGHLQTPLTVEKLSRAVRSVSKLMWYSSSAALEDDVW